MKTYGDTLIIDGSDAKVFNGNFDEISGGFLAPYVYTKDVPEFIRQKAEYNARVESGEIKREGGYKPYYRLDYIEIEVCNLCSGNGCDNCYNSGWVTRPLNES